MWENELDEHLIGDLIVITLEGMEVLERHLLEGKTGIDLLDGLELCVETIGDVLLSIINRELGHPLPEISPNSENIIWAYSLPEALLEKIKEKRITQISYFIILKILPLLCHFNVRSDWHEG